MTRRNRGFTLIELVVTVALSAVVVAFMALFLIAPVDGFAAHERRTSLADSANNAVRLLDYDIRSALPDSVRFVRNGSIVTIELLRVEEATRYRKSGEGGGALQELDLDTPENRFTTVGAFRPSSMQYLALGHVGMGLDAYTLANVITPAGSATVAIGGTPDEDVVTINPAFTFIAATPTNKIFAVSTPVAYVCNETARTLARITGYPISAGIAAQAGLGTSASVAGYVTSCAVSSIPGTAGRGTLVMMQLVFSRDGETLNVMHQSRVENVP
jgi:MSHA biogenesis protein MshO